MAGAHGDESDDLNAIASVRVLDEDWAIVTIRRDDGTFADFTASRRPATERYDQWLAERKSAEEHRGE